MRRVIVEQIDALAELNRIVARHGRAIDTVQPPRASVREEGIAAVASATGLRGSPARSDFAGLGRVEAPRWPEPRQPESRQSSNDGWLHDVLNRAGRDEEPPREREDYDRAPAERPVVSSIDSISLDIARMVDHDAAVDLWEQRQRGEPVSPDRQLYTAEGQQTFEEIRRKYRADREFRTTVDRYIAEFERLLDEVAQDDRGLAVAHSYLTSETGKVYTMLAHAAGRLN
jgi:hypothetical protein